MSHVSRSATESRRIAPMIRVSGSIAFALALSAAAVARAGSADETSRGRLLAQRYCASCHAVGRQGKSPNAAAPPFRDLHVRYQIDDLEEALAEGILVGHPAMPEMRFPPEDVTAILAYLRSIQTREQAASPAGAPGPAR